MSTNDELLFVVDENNEPLEPLPRHEVHKNGLWHRVSLVWVVNDKKEILCQKRTLHKDTNPGKWEVRFGGHVSPEQEYIDAAMNEVNEELGLNVEKDHLEFLEIHKHDDHHRDFGADYLLIWNGDSNVVKFEREEVEEVKWVPIHHLVEVVKRKDPEWVTREYEEHVLNSLLQR